MDDKSYYDKISTTPTTLFDMALGHENSHERYTDMEEVGQGVVKKIKRALDISSGRLVAMAVPQEKLSKEQLQRFHEEARLTASLEHSNIMQVYDLGFNREGKPYFTMKLCSSQKLSDLLDDKETSLFQLLDIFLRVCDAMSYAHNAGAVHRDLKPENILLGNFGEVFVSDWGSAQLIPGSILEDEVGTLSKPLTKGTPGFMAPEQVSSEPLATQDIFTLGVILYQILCRKVPAAENSVKPSEINSEVPVGLEAVCLKAMAKLPENRYRKVDEIIREIKAWMSGYATQAEDAGFRKQLLLMIQRHKALSVSMAASIIIIAVLSAVYISSLKEKEKQTRTQRDRAEKALELYDLEKESREKIAVHGADHFIDAARRMVHIHSLKDAEDLLQALPDSAISEKQQKKISFIKGRIAFYRQQFNKAIHLLESGSGEDRRALIQLAGQFLKIKSDDKSLLQTQDMVELLRAADRIRTYHAYGLYRYQILHFTDTMGQTPLIEQMILVNNENINSLNIKMTEENGRYHLDVSNNPKMTNMVPIRKVQISSLNLANSPVSTRNFDVLFELPIEELNLSGCGIKNYAFIQNMKSLKTLILNSDEAGSPSLKAFAPQLKIIVKSFPKNFILK